MPRRNQRELKNEARKIRAAVKGLEFTAKQNWASTEIKDRLRELVALHQADLEQIERELAQMESLQPTEQPSTDVTDVEASKKIQQKMKLIDDKWKREAQNKIASMHKKSGFNRSQKPLQAGAPGLRNQKK